MIISHKYKFIFIKTRKTAGTSIEVFLSNVCAENDIVTPIWPVVEGHRPRNYKKLWNPIPELFHSNWEEFKSSISDFIRLKKFYNHIPAWLVRERISKEIWDNYFKFCVERNPWDKTLSHFYMQKNRSKYEMTFDEYIRNGNFCINAPLYTDKKGKIIVDHVIKYENLNSELNSIFNNLGIPFSGELGVKAKSSSRKDRRHYREIYSSEQQKIIEKAFMEEIRMHDYHF